MDFKNKFIDGLILGNIENFTLIIVIIICAMLLGGFLYYKVSSFFKVRLFRKRMERGERGEEIGKKFLIKKGFTIVEEQPKESSIILIDGEAHTYNVRADFLVERKGRRSIVEVKTGNISTNPKSINTRRQLLEYSRIYDVDNLLFFDAESKKLKTISFPEIEKKSQLVLFITIFLIGIITGIALAVWLRSV